MEWNLSQMIKFLWRFLGFVRIPERYGICSSGRSRLSKYLSVAEQGSGLTQKLNETQAALDDTQSKLEETQTALQNAEGKISSLSKKLEEEKEKNDNKLFNPD